MASDKHKAYAGEAFPLEFLNNKPVVNLAFLFYEQDDETEIDFSDQIDCTFKIWEDDEDGNLLLSISEGNGITSSGNLKVINTSAGQMNLGTGKYYYEFSYYVTGGYEIPLMFTEAKFI